MPRKSSSALEFSTSAADRIKPPDDLTGEARRIFIDLVCSCRPDHFDPVDAPLLARYARALVEVKVAADELALEYIVDSKPSPWLAIWQAKIRAVTTLSRMLKLNPAGIRRHRQNRHRRSPTTNDRRWRRSAMANIDPLDRAAFDLAIETVRRESAMQRKRIDDGLAAGRDYASVGRFAAHSLGLMPWQLPPCYADMCALDQPYGDPGAKRESAELALRMRRLNVSRWHPNPARECDRVEAEVKRQPAL